MRVRPVGTAATSLANAMNDSAPTVTRRRASGVVLGRRQLQELAPPEARVAELERSVVAAEGNW